MNFIEVDTENFEELLTENLQLCKGLIFGQRIQCKNAFEISTGIWVYRIANKEQILTAWEIL